MAEARTADPVDQIHERADDGLHRPRSSAAPNASTRPAITTIPTTNHASAEMSPSIANRCQDWSVVSNRGLATRARP